MLQGLDLGRRQPQPAEAIGAGAAQRPRVKRVKCRAQASPDRCGACGRKLLAANDMGKPDKTGLAPPQARHARDLEDRPKPRVALEERPDRLFEVVLAVEVEGHCT